MTINSLKKEIENTSSFTENTEFRTIDTQDLRFLSQTSNFDKEGMLNDMKKLEEEFGMMKRVINILDVQMQSKDAELEKSRAEIIALRCRVSALTLVHNRARHTTHVEFMNRKIMSESKIANKSNNHTETHLTQADMGAFMVCIAEALENCISYV